METKIEKGVLTITIDVSEKAVKAGNKSASGKSIVIASTHGNVKLANGMTLGLNLYTKA